MPSLKNPRQNLLITGATGFIGRHLIEKLSESEINIAAAVREKTETLPQSVRQIIVGDFLNDPNWQAALGEINTVIHLAAATESPKNATRSDANRLYHLNVEASVKLGEAAIKAGVSKFIFISSAKVYGGKSSKPFNEQDQCNPEDDYAKSKLEAEQKLKHLVANKEMALVIIRPPLIYGSGVGGNFQKLVSLVEKGIPLPLKLVNNQRTLCSVYNLVDFIEKSIDHPAAANEIFLVGDSEDLSTTELLSTIAAHLEKKVVLLPLPIWSLKAIAMLLGRKSLVSRLVDDLQVDISKAQNQLGWEPPLSADIGLKRTLSN